MNKKHFLIYTLILSIAFALMFFNVNFYPKWIVIDKIDSYRTNKIANINSHFIKGYEIKNIVKSESFTSEWFEVDENDEPINTTQNNEVIVYEYGLSKEYHMNAEKSKIPIEIKAFSTKVDRVSPVKIPGTNIEIEHIVPTKIEIQKELINKNVKLYYRCKISYDVANGFLESMYNYKINKNFIIINDKSYEFELREITN